MSENSGAPAVPGRQAGVALLDESALRFRWSAQDRGAERTNMTQKDKPISKLGTAGHTLWG